MDNSTSGIPEKRSLSLSNGPSFRRSTGSRPSSGGSGGGTLDLGAGTAPNHLPHTKIIVYSDEKGYGMKVSGDNPVYVQSVKEGGPAEKAGLHRGDKIIKVNGVTVTHSTHIEVVDLIKSSPYVELTVQQHPAHRSGSLTPLLTSPTTPSSTSPTMASPPPSRPLQHHHSAPARDRITGPQPVDYKKQVELENERLQMTRVMLEHEQNYVEMLRSNLARCHESRQESDLTRQLASAERRVARLQQQIVALTQDKEQPTTILPLSRHVLDLPPGYEGGDTPPPLPTRNPLPPRVTSPSPSLPSSPPSGGVPPPLPPRQYLLQMDKLTSGGDLLLSASSSNNCSMGTPVHKHHRTKSSPDTLNASSMAEASKRLIDTECLHELSIGGAKRTRGGVAWDVESPRSTPPGTPPPPYAVPPASGGGGALPDEICDITPDDTDKAGDHSDQLQQPVGSPPGSVQPPIISMEDDDMSDQEVSQLEDHGPFKSLNKLWAHHAHLAVFMNYVISNSDPSSLLFYLVTDLYKEGNAKEMKKWAYEIHSSFLVPCAPLRLNNVDENVAREVDDCLLKESDKEEIMRKIFWKARLKAKEELNEQLADFQQKRTAGLGMLFGPSDAHLEESINDKSKELKIVETILVPKLEPFLTDMENDGVVAVDGRRFTTAAALGTILGKKFGLRGQHFSSLIERCPTFVSKDKSLKSKLIGKSRKVTLMGHHFVAHQYFTVTYCNHCQLIIWGIGPQGYQCSNCHLNIHRHCVKVLDENCPGPMVKKEKGNDRISKFMEKIRPENTRRKPSSLNLGTDRLRRQHEEKDDTGGTVADNELGSDRLSSSTSGGRGASGGGGGGSERRPDPVREAVEERMGGGRTNAASDPHHNDDDQHNQSHHELTHIAKPKSSAATINRSESYKERIPNKRQLRERRKTSDPNLSKTNNDVDIDNQTLTCHANSGSSSNSSLSTSRSLDSPSNSLEAVSGGGRGGAGGTGEGTNGGSVGVGAQWDSDLEAEPDPPDWTRQVPPDVLASLTTMEKKRQEVINELFHTERSHVRGLKVLDQVFFRPMRDQQILPPEQMQLLFANLDEMLAVHGHFNQSMKARRHEADPLIARVGDLILNMFDGAEGEVFQRAAATFCARQQIALEALKERRRKDQKLHSFLTDAEASPLCRRLQLKDIIPTGMLRLTKYPLLFENLAKYTAADSEEAGQVQRAVERSKQILNFVDKAVKEAEDQHRLAEIQRRLDKTPFDKADNPLATEFRNLDLTKHRLIHEGALVWRIASRPKPIDLHVLLLEDVIILLQKQDEKYVLKFYSATQFYSPVIKVSTVLVRTNAVDKTGLFLVNTSQNGAQIYDLVATSPQEKRKWFKHISEAAEAYKQRDGRNRRADAAAAAAAAAQQDLDASEHPAHDKTKDMEDATGSDLLSPPRGGATNGHDESPPPHSPTPSPSDASPSPSIQPPDTPTTDSIARRMGDSLSPSPSLSRKVAEPLRLTTAESALIQPSEVLVSQRPVLTAEPVLTPLEKLRRKDEAIKQALAEKQQLVADILHVPKDEFDTIAEIAGEPSSEKEASELILAAVNQANQLSAMVNEALRVSEEDAVSAGMTPRNGGASKAAAAAGVPAHKLNAIATSLNTQLTQLLSVLVQRDDERERLRRELQRSREQLHALHEQRAHHDDQPLSSSEPGAAVVEEAVQSTATEESSQESANPVNESTTAPTTAQEVFVDALSGEAESHLEAAAATSVGGGGETVADSVD